MSLRKPVAVVTGSNRLNGIGWAVCRQLGTLKPALGGPYHVVVTSRDMASGDQAVKALREKGVSDVSLVQLDTTSQESCNKAASSVAEIAEGKLAVLVNNSGYAPKGGAVDVDLQEFDKCMDVNVKGAIRVTTAMLPLLRHAAKATPSQFPRIVNVSSILGSLNEAADPNSMSVRNFRTSAYNQSKAALNMYTANLSCELQREGITVNAVHPGLIATSMTEGLNVRAPNDNEWGAGHIVDVVVLARTGKITGGYWHNKLHLRW
jgi:NAD(P)-dependent dehydrogenase (short-subunit alcohol dehydrogenase family)